MSRIVLPGAREVFVQDDPMESRKVVWGEQTFPGKRNLISGNDAVACVTSCKEVVDVIQTQFSGQVDLVIAGQFLPQHGFGERLVFYPGLTLLREVKRQKLALGTILMGFNTEKLKSKCDTSEIDAVIDLSRVLHNGVFHLDKFLDAVFGRD